MAESGSATAGRTSGFASGAVTGEFAEFAEFAGISGLTREEAQERLARFGPNLLVERRPGSGLVQWLWMLADPMALVLANAANQATRG
jgi:hypothetical protein